MATHIRDYLSTHLDLVRRNYRPIHSAIVAGAFASLVLGRAAWKDYQVYLSYGPGGMPYNVAGWFLTSTVVRAISINVFDVRDFENNPDERTWLGRNWPEKPRSGVRPKIGPHPIPQRQLDQHSSTEIQEKFLHSFRALVEQYPRLVVSKQSGYERHADALWANETHEGFALGEGYSREITHIHQNTDYSAHVILAPKDALKVIQSGWGQLHGLAGVKPLGRKLLPKEYVLLYAPRDDDEIEVLLGIVKASIGYMTVSENLALP